MKTKAEIEYKMFYKTVIIPAGTGVVPATNLPDDDGPLYWAQQWAGMSDVAESWHRNYGFLLRECDVSGE